MKILFIKTSALGDIVQCFDAAAACHEGGHSVDWVCEAMAADFVRAQPFVRRVIAVDTKKWRKDPKNALEPFRKAVSLLRSESYDLVFDLQTNLKSALFFVLAKGAQRVSFAAPAEWPHRFIPCKRIAVEPKMSQSMQYRSCIEAIFGPLPSRISQWTGAFSRVLLCPGTNWSNKALGLTQWKKLIARLSDEFDEIDVAFHGPLEEQFAKELIAKTKAKLFAPRPLAACQEDMRNYAAVVSVDSVLLHLASFVGVPTLSFFGPSLGRVYAPPKSAFVQGSCPYGVSFIKRCPKLRTCKTGACSKNLDATMHIENFIQQVQARRSDRRASIHA